MEIYPQNLGAGFCKRLLAERGLTPAPEGREEEKSQTRLESESQFKETFAFVGTMWGCIAAVWPVLLQSHFLPEMTHLIEIGLAGSTVGFGGGYAGSMIYNRRRRERHSSQKTTPTEIEAIGVGREPLALDYLKVVAMVQSLPLQDARTTQSIREALRSLGEAVESLPPPSAGVMLADRDFLVTQAAQLSAQARTETDAVIAASLARQAEALKSRSETIARTQTLIRRHEMLRDEVYAQVMAFQTSLAAAQIDDGLGGSDFAALAENVAAVAQEANTLAAARAELDAALVGHPSKETPLSIGTGH